jgi:hypothetical protein
MNKETVIQRLCEVAPDYLEDFWGCKNTCMHSSDMAVTVLNHYGHKAELKHTSFFAGCPLGWSMIIGDTLPEDMPEDGWWTTGCTPETELPTDTPLAHVVAVSGSTMIDLSIGQFNVPKKGIHLPKAYVEDTGSFVNSADDSLQIGGITLADGSGFGYCPLSSQPWVQEDDLRRKYLKAALPGLLDLIDPKRRRRQRLNSLVRRRYSSVA